MEKDENEVVVDSVKLRITNRCTRTTMDNTLAIFALKNQGGGTFTEIKMVVVAYVDNTEDKYYNTNLLDIKVMEHYKVVGFTKVNL